MLKLILIGFIGVFLTSVAQVILKRGATLKHEARALEFYLNLYTVCGYSIMLIVTLINLYIFRTLDLKYILIFLPSTYVLVFLLSGAILHEKIDKRKLLQYSIVMVGVFIFNL
jgi:hypothetical protein